MLKISPTFINTFNKVQKTNQINFARTISNTIISNDDVFIKKQPTITYEKDFAGEPLLQLIQTDKKSEIQTLDGQPLYTSIKGKDFSQEIIYSLNGSKLYDITTQPNGDDIKKFYMDDGKTISSTIIFDKDLNVKSKKVFNSPKIKVDNQKPNDLPEYLYHFTSEDNYKAILESKEIRVSGVSDYEMKACGNEGIFLVDSKNLLNHWTSLKDKKRYSYITMLLKFCNKNQKNEIMILKIPTSKLNIKDLTFRNQNYVMGDIEVASLDDGKLEKYYAFLRLIKQINGNLPPHKKGIPLNIFYPEITQHLRNGCSLLELKKHSSNPCEFVYKTSISTDIIEDATKIDISKIKSMSIKDQEAEKISTELIENALNILNN